MCRVGLPKQHDWSAARRCFIHLSVDRLCCRSTACGAGFAGEFSDDDLTRLERCLPPSSVFYREPDAQARRCWLQASPLHSETGMAESSCVSNAADSLCTFLQVYKAEDSTYWHPPDTQDEVDQQQQRRQDQQGKGERRRFSRRMQQTVMTVPRVEAFEGKAEGSLCHASSSCLA